LSRNYSPIKSEAAADKLFYQLLYYYNITGKNKYPRFPSFRSFGYQERGKNSRCNPFLSLTDIFKGNYSTVLEFKFYEMIFTAIVP
jgi:hypothetical protein